MKNTLYFYNLTAQMLYEILRNKYEIVVPKLILVSFSGVV